MSEASSEEENQTQTIPAGRVDAAVQEAPWRHNRRVLHAMGREPATAFVERSSLLHLPQEAVLVQSGCTGFWVEQIRNNEPVMMGTTSRLSEGGHVLQGGAMSPHVLQGQQILQSHHGLVMPSAHSVMFQSQQQWQGHPAAPQAFVSQPLLQHFAPANLLGSPVDCCEGLLGQALQPNLHGHDLPGLVRMACQESAMDQRQLFLAPQSNPALGHCQNSGTLWANSLLPQVQSQILGSSCGGQCAATSGDLLPSWQGHQHVLGPQVFAEQLVRTPVVAVHTPPATQAAECDQGRTHAAQPPCAATMAEPNTALSSQRFLQQQRETGSHDAAPKRQATPASASEPDATSWTHAHSAAPPDATEWNHSNPADVERPESWPGWGSSREERLEAAEAMGLSRRQYERDILGWHNRDKK